MFLIKHLNHRHKDKCKGSSVRPKFGIGAKFRPKLWVSVSVSEPKFFFPKPKLFFFQNFSIFFMYFCFLGEYKFSKTWNWTQTFKSYLKILKIWQQIWFKRVLLWLKKYPILLVTRFFLWNVVLVSAESISQFGFRYRT